MCIFVNKLPFLNKPLLDYIMYLKSLQNSLFAGVFFQLLVLKKYNYAIRN